MVGWTLSLTYCFFLLPLSDCDGKHWHYWTLPYFSFSCDGTHCPERSYCYSYCRTLSCDGKHCQFPTLCLQAILIERCTCTTIPIKVLWSVVWPLPLQGGGGGCLLLSRSFGASILSRSATVIVCILPAFNNNGRPIKCCWWMLRSMETKHIRYRRRGLLSDEHYQVEVDPLPKRMMLRRLNLPIFITVGHWRWKRTYDAYNTCVGKRLRNS